MTTTSASRSIHDIHACRQRGDHRSRRDRRHRSDPEHHQHRCRRGRAHRQGQRRRDLHVGLLPGAAAAAQAVREGQGRAVERHHRPAVGHRGRARRGRDPRPGGVLGRPVARPLRRHRRREVGRQGVARVRHRPAPLDPVAVPPRRAGRAAVHGEDHRDRAVVRRQAVRRDPGRRRGPSRRGLQPLHRGEARWRVPGQRPLEDAARRHHQRLAAGT